MIISDFLINCGHEVLVAENGEVGIRRCSETIDFVITPLLMPKKDGLEVIMEVKNKWPSIQIITLGTKWDCAPDLDICKMAKILGASYVLHQPFNLFELLAVVNRCKCRRELMDTDVESFGT
jgi:DNA-binding response OmpR family regulator